LHASLCVRHGKRLDESYDEGEHAELVEDCRFLVAERGTRMWVDERVEGGVERYGGGVAAC
jgi:hypothetical protein